MDNLTLSRLNASLVMFSVNHCLMRKGATTYRLPNLLIHENSFVDSRNILLCIDSLDK